jgi:hypothetical protein
MAQGSGNLLGQLVMQAVDQVADVVLDVADVEVLPADEAGIEHVHQVRDDFDNRFAARQGFVAEVVDPAALGVRRHEGFRDLRQSFLETKVGSHDGRGIL